MSISRRQRERLQREQQEQEQAVAALLLPDGATEPSIEPPNQPKPVASRELRSLAPVKADQDKESSSTSPAHVTVEKDRGSSASGETAMRLLNLSDILPLPPEINADLDLSQLPQDLVLVAVASYWSFFHVAYPILHRRSFEESFSTAPSFFYGVNPPSALLTALAATGLRYVKMPGLTDDVRLRLSWLWASRAREQLIAGYYTPGSQTMTDLEAAQTLFLMYTQLVAEMLTPSPVAYLRNIADLLPKLVTDPETGDIIGTRPAQNHNEWIRTEMILRLKLAFVNVHEGLAYLIDHPLIVEDIVTQVTLPAHEIFFDVVEPDEVFQLLQGESLEPAWATMNLSPFLSPELEEVDARQMVRRLVEGVFARRESCFSIVHCLSLLRRLRNILRSFCSSNGIDPIGLASDTPEKDSPPEALYRRRVAIFQVMVAEMTAALPPDIADSLGRGDPGLLLSNASSYFTDLGYAHTTLSIYIAAHGLLIENWLDVGEPGIAFFSSGPFLNILESGILAARLMEGQLAEDPCLRWHRAWAYIPALRVGGFHVAAVKVCRNAPQGVYDTIEAAKRDAYVVARWTETLGRYYKPYGFQLFLNYRKMLEEAGIYPTTPEHEVATWSPTLYSNAPESFTETVLAVERWARTWNSLNEISLM